MKTRQNQTKDKNEVVVAARQEQRPGRGAGWTKALDVDAYDLMLAAAYLHVRDAVLHLTVSEAERRSGVSRPFWRKVERGEMHPSTHTEVLMCNALRVRPSTLHRLAERWLHRGRRLKAWLLWLPALQSDFLMAAAGV